MIYEGENIKSIFARCQCGRFKRFDRNEITYKNEVRIILNPYKCQACGVTHSTITGVVDVSIKKKHIRKIYIFKNENIELANIEQLFETHGPYILNGQRLDQLTKVQLIIDSSTISSHQIGTEINAANTGSVIGRAIVGGVLLGGAGAIIGGLSGKRESEINTQSNSTIETELTAELIFETGSSIYVLIKDKKSFHWLLSFANQPSLTDEDLNIEKQKAEEYKKKEQEESIKYLKDYNKEKEKLKYIKNNPDKEVNTKSNINLIIFILGIIFILYSYFLWN